LQLLPGGGVSGTNGLIDFVCSKLFSLSSISSGNGKGKAMLFFKCSGCLDRPPGFPLTEPNFPIEIHPTGDNVHVVVVGILVAHGYIGSSICVVPHFFHKVFTNPTPLFRGQEFALWQ